MQIVKYNNHPQAPKNPQEETPFFWYILGAIVLALIINDISHIMTGEGIFTQLKDF